jgi:hypothetical protein
VAGEEPQRVPVQGVPPGSRTVGQSSGCYSADLDLGDRTCSLRTGKRGMRGRQARDDMSCDIRVEDSYR